MYILSIKRLSVCKRTVLDLFLNNVVYHVTETSAVHRDGADSSLFADPNSGEGFGPQTQPIAAGMFS